MTRSGVARKLFAVNRVRRALLPAALVLGTLLQSACLYTFSGGGGLPKGLRSVAVQPFDNQTAVPDLQREILDQLRRGMRDRLNLREAPEARADVVVRGTIVRYDVDLPAGVSADPRQTTSTRRRLQIVIDFEMLNQKTGQVLYKRAGSTKEGQYAEGGEAVGRRNAVESLVNELLEGAQSQW
ncbi:MAG: LptE family protein [Gemmatimonadota bacterium]